MVQNVRSRSIKIAFKNIFQRKEKEEMKSYKDWEQEKIIQNMSDKRLEYEYNETSNIRIKMFAIFSIANCLFAMMLMKYISLDSIAINLCITAGIFINMFVHHLFDRRNIKYILSITKEQNKRAEINNIIQKS